MTRPTAKLYFNRGSEAVAKDLAARVRNEGNHCNLIHAHLFAGDHDVEDGTSAVAIQASAGKASQIARAYKAQLPECETHFFNDAGEFVDGPDQAEPAARDAFASLKAAAKQSSEPVAVESGGPAEDIPVAETGSTSEDDGAAETSTDGTPADAEQPDL